MSSFINSINDNKFFVGLMVVTVAVGSRFIIDEFSQEHIILFHNNHYIRKVFIFGVCFVATRDIMISLIVTLLFTMFISGIHDKEPEYFSLQEDKERHKQIEKKEIIKNIELSLNKLKV